MPSLGPNNFTLYLSQSLPLGSEALVAIRPRRPQLLIILMRARASVLRLPPGSGFPTGCCFSGVWNAAKGFYCRNNKARLLWFSMPNQLCSDIVGLGLCWFGWRGVTLRQMNGGGWPCMTLGMTGSLCPSLGWLVVYSGMFSSVFLFKTLLQGLLW